MTSIELSFGEKIFAATALTSTSIGCLASILLVLLIRDMGKWNDFIYLVYYMTIFQFLFDLLLPSFVYPPLSDTVLLFRGFALLFSLISYAISAVISYTIFHVLHFKVIFNLLRWKWFIAMLVTIPALVMVTVIFFGLYTNNDAVLQVGLLMSTVGRLIYACFNAVFFFLYKYQVYKLTNLRKDKLTDSDIAMRCLVDRTKWYPIIQIIIRILPTVNQLTYGFDGSFYDATKLRFYLLLIAYVITSFAPVGFLIIFLSMQPKAYKHAKGRFLGFFSCQKHPSLAESEIFNNSSLPQNNNSFFDNNNHNNSNKKKGLQTKNAIATMSSIEQEESEADWENRSMAPVNVIHDNELNEENVFKDSETITAAFVSSNTDDHFINGNNLSLHPANFSNISRLLEVVSKAGIKTAVDYSGSSSQRLRATQIENLNDDELIELATESNRTENNRSSKEQTKFENEIL